MAGRLLGEGAEAPYPLRVTVVVSPQSSIAKPDSQVALCVGIRDDLATRPVEGLVRMSRQEPV